MGIAKDPVYVGGSSALYTNANASTTLEFKVPEETTMKLSNPKDVIGTRKSPMSTIPANVLAEMGVAMLEGTAKYGRHNYREVGVRASIYYDAVLRHIFAWWEGEDIDPDSGMSHITKAMTALVVLRDSMTRENWTDDRPPKSNNFYAELNKLSGEILDRHADKSPKHVTELNKVVPVVENSNNSGKIDTLR